MIYTIFYLAGSRGCRYFLKKNKTIPQKELVIYKRGQYCYYISQKTLQVGTRIVKSSGYDLVDAILDPEAAREQTAEHGAYELTMKDAGLTEDGEVIPDWDSEV